MTETKKTISEDDRLKALALAVTANDLYRQACQFDMAAQRLLGMDTRFYGDGCLGDLIYDGDTPVTVAAFNEALERGGYKVEDAQQK